MHYYPGYARLPESALGKQGINSCRYPFTTPGSRETSVDKKPCLGAYTPASGLEPGPSDRETRARTTIPKCSQQWPCPCIPYYKMVFKVSIGLFSKCRAPSFVLSGFSNGKLLSLYFNYFLYYKSEVKNHIAFDSIKKWKKKSI